MTDASLTPHEAENAFAAEYVLGVLDLAERAEAEAEPEPRKKKRKKKREAAGSRSELDANGRERPRFLLTFPVDPDLDRLVAAFERGDFATVRADAPALADRAEDERVRDAALELRQRIDPDPLIRYLLLASVILLAVLVLHAYSHKL